MPKLMKRKRNPELRKQMVELMKKRATSKGKEWLRLDKEISALQRKMDTVETRGQTR